MAESKWTRHEVQFRGVPNGEWGWREGDLPRRGIVDGRPYTYLTQRDTQQRLLSRWLAERAEGRWMDGWTVNPVFNAV